jgi:hypothetical protein
MWQALSISMSSRSLKFTSNSWNEPAIDPKEFVPRMSLSRLSRGPKWRRTTKVLT